MQWLKTNTATRITVGPFFDNADGVTPEVAITVTNEKLTLVVDDAGVPTLVLDTAPSAAAGNNDMVHITGDDAGYYDLELTAANVNYVGRAKLALTNAAVHCPVFHEFMILSAAAYDWATGAAALKVDVDTIKTNPVVNGGTVTFASNTTVANTTGAVGSVTGNVGGSVASVASGGIAAASFAAGAIDAAAIAANAIGASEIADGAIDAGAIAADAITAAKIADGAIDAATFAAGAITAAAVATDAIDADALAADAVTEIWAKAIAELAQATPSATPTVLNAIAMLYMMARNKGTQTATTKSFFNDAGTEVFKKAVADDGSTYTEDEMVAGT